MSDEDPLSSLTLYSSSDTDTPSAATLRRHKLVQTESQFLAQKSSWLPQDDISLAHTRLTLPLASTSPTLTPEALKMRAEQEYYLRRYTDAVRSAKEALRMIEIAEGEDGEVGKRWGEGEMREMRELVGRCEKRIGEEQRKL